nr:MAG TPA: helix-turn-helix domain protein [Caudoviricetes sp.]
MESPILQRVIQIIKELNLTDNQFSKRLKIAQTTMSGYLSGNRKLSLQVIESVLSEFEDISAEWLLRGEGEMYKADDKNINDNFDNSQYVSKSKYESTVYLLAEVTNNLKETVLENKKLYEENKELRSQLKIAKSA